MKKTRFITVVMSIVLLILMTVQPAFATTYYYSSGYELYQDDVSNGWIINSYSLDANEISLPSVLLDNIVTTIGGRSFEKREDLTYLYMPDTITTVGAYAFDNCSSLSVVMFSENLTNIHAGAFRRCCALTSLDLSKTNISFIANAAFYRCTSLEEVVLPNTVVTIGESTFANCPNLKSIIIDKGVTSIADSAFDNSPEVVFYCYYESYAYNYANTNNIPCVLLDGIKLGDANGDGYVNVNDVTAIQRHAAELELLEDIYFHAADINGDGDVSVDDATELQRFLAEYVVDYPIGEVMTQ